MVARVYKVSLAIEDLKDLQDQLVQMALQGLTGLLDLMVAKASMVAADTPAA